MHVSDGSRHVRSSVPASKAKEHLSVLRSGDRMMPARLREYKGILPSFGAGSTCIRAWTSVALTRSPDG
eukprot:scaffold90541_cov63-Phaeocystis_antarctica.AAC.2